MPRFNLKDDEDLEMHFRESFLADDGDVESGVDMCMDCATDVFLETGQPADEPHPPYEDGDYVCLNCAVELTEKDN